MAVELLITNMRNGTKQLVPVATMDVYRTYWKPAISELQLQIVPLLEDGLFTKSDIPEMLRELDLIRGKFQAMYTPDVSHALAKRVDGAKAAFEAVLGNSELEIS
jgi:hypothetical protein